MLGSVRRLMTTTASLGIIAVAISTALGTVSASAQGGLTPGESEGPRGKHVTYVKVCSLYGAGFYYVPEASTCVKPYLGIEGGYGWSNNNFAVNPAFNVNGSGGVFGINGGVQFGIPGTRVFVGPEVGALWGNMDGSTSNPPASPASTYSANRAFIEFAGFTAGISESFYDFYSAPISFYGSVGIANVRTNVTCTCGASDSATRAGFTGSVGVGIPIVNTPVEVDLQYRYINVSESNFNIPGTVPISGNINILTMGLRWQFGTAAPPSPSPPPP